MAPNDISRVQSELEELGYAPTLHNWKHGVVVEFDYTVEVGTHTGQMFRLGMSFQEQGYSEYPPHWIHVSPPVDDGLGGVQERYQTADGREWIALSRPPSDIWDNLPVKNMRHYLDEHIRRFWSRM